MKIITSQLLEDLYQNFIFVIKQIKFPECLIFKKNLTRISKHQSD